MSHRIITSFCLFLIALGGFFVKGDILLQPENIFQTGILYSMNEVSAAEPPAANDTTQKESDIFNTAIIAINSLLGVVTALVTPAIIFAGWLLSPDWTSGDLFGLRPIMHNLWVTVSNIIYFVYAILLIVIALGTIFGSDKFGYKTLLPRLALGILMVPFTWWFVQWVVSLSAVVTTSVISIPMEVVQSTVGANTYFDKKIIPTKYVVDTTGTGNAQNISQCSDGSCTSVREVINKGGGAYATMLIYAYDIFKLQDSKDTSDPISKIKYAGQLFNSLVIGALMFLVFGILVMALIFMLMVRVIKLWMYAIFSPLFTFHYVAGKELLGGDKLGDFSLKEFIGLAFVPAIVGITLSFGLVVISAIRSPVPQDASFDCKNIDITLDANGNYSGGGCSITMFGNSENKLIRGIATENNEKKEYNVIRLAGIDVIFKGKAKLDNSNNGTIQSVIDGVGGVFGTIIIDIIALIFIWTAFMAAKNVNKAVSAAAQPFEDLGKNIGRLGASLPKYAPLPIPGGSIAGATKIANTASSVLDYKKDERLKDSGMYKALNNMMGGNQPSAGDMANFRSAVQSKNLTDMQNIMKKQDSKALVSGDMLKSVRDSTDNVRFAVERSNFDEQDKKAIYALLENKDKLTDRSEESYKLMALLNGEKARNLTASGTVQAKTYLDENNKSTPASPGNGGERNAMKITVVTNDRGEKSFTINTVGVNADIDNGSADAIAKAISTSGLKGSYTEGDFRKIMNTASQFDDSTGDKREKLNEIMKILKNTDGFFTKS